MISGAFIYRTPQEIEGLYDHFLGGLFFVKGLPLVCQLTVLTSFLLAAYFGVRSKKTPSLLFSLIGFTSLVTLIHQPWDELFVNLLHAKNLSEHGTFSFLLKQPTEGTVDTLPYFTLGMLGKLGLPLLEFSILMSLLGGIACIFLLANCIAYFRGLKSTIWPVFFLSLYSPLIFNASQGFTTTLFAAVVLASLYYLDIKKTPKGWVFVSLLPLIRTEGLWIVLLLLGREFIFRKKKNPSLVFSLLPGFALLLWRYLTFGTLTPVPMHFKATFGNLFFFLLGVRNLWCDLLASYAVLFLLFYHLNKGKEKRLTEWLFLTALGVLPYYLTGGDWFPAAWGRYFLPFSLVACIAFGSTWNMGNISKQWPLVFASLLFVILPSSSYVGLFEDVFTKKKTLSNTNYREKARTNFRIQYLSQVGTHLGKVTDPQDVIGTSEVATIHYFANREPLDLLGITNEEIAKSPLRTPELFRRFPKYNELPYLIFRRVNPSLVEKYRPTVIYPFDFMFKDLMRDLTFEEFDDTQVLRALRRWEHRFKGLMDPLYGGVDRLLSLGYQPFIVLYENEFATLYFIEKNTVEAHKEKLLRAGFTGGFRSQPGL